MNPVKVGKKVLGVIGMLVVCKVETAWWVNRRRMTDVLDCLVKVYRSPGLCDADCEWIGAMLRMLWNGMQVNI